MATRYTIRKPHRSARTGRSSAPRARPHSDDVRPRPGTEARAATSWRRNEQQYRVCSRGIIHGARGSNLHESARISLEEAGAPTPPQCSCLALRSNFGSSSSLGGVWVSSAPPWRLPVFRPGSLRIPNEYGPSCAHSRQPAPEAGASQTRVVAGSRRSPYRHGSKRRGP